MPSIKFVRSAFIAFICSILAACSQTAVSTYSGKLGSAASSKELRQQKILAARARARKAKAARRAAFNAKREARKEARKNRSAKRKSRTATRKKVRGTKKVSRKRVTVRKSIKRTAKKRVAKKRLKKDRFTKQNKAKRRVASATKKSRRLRVKKTRKAFVPSVARRAGRLRLNAPWRCVPKRLKGVIYQIRKRWGPVTVSSTHRSKRRNRLVGGKRRSWHLRCRAVDFRVHANTRGLLTWLKRHPHVGGYKRYRSGYFHIDTGPKRTW